MGDRGWALDVPAKGKRIRILKRPAAAPADGGVIGSLRWVAKVAKLLECLEQLWASRVMEVGKDVQLQAGRRERSRFVLCVCFSKMKGKLARVVRNGVVTDEGEVSSWPELPSDWIKRGRAFFCCGNAKMEFSPLTEGDVQQWWRPPTPGFTA